MQGGDRAVVGQAMVPANYAETDNVPLFIEDLEAFGAPCRGEAGDDVDFPEGADVAVATDEVAALHEVFVGLGVVEAAHDGPHGGDGGGDLLRHGGAALVGGHRVGVVSRDRVRHRREGLHDESVVAVCDGGSGGGVDTGVVYPVKEDG